VKTVRAVADLRAALVPARRADRSVGLVPTMGAFHAGHRALIRRARADCDVVVVSLFVNPAQFEDDADLAAYPRDEAADAAQAADLGVDVLFAPPAAEVYPPGFSTTVHVAGVTEGLEGAHRGASHFDGVATVVLKLLNMAAPDVAYFGQKDAQQAAMVRRLVRDLDLLVRIEVVPIERAADGLALSSRNAHLAAGDRGRALALSRGLQAVAGAVAAGERDAEAAAATGRAAMARLGVEPEYVTVVAPDTFAPLARIDGEALVAVAARVGPTRLIDNIVVHPNKPARGASAMNRAAPPLEEVS
jgi:pantoate--beta-alanine ligase